MCTPVYRKWFHNVCQGGRALSVPPHLEQDVTQRIHVIKLTSKRLLNQRHSKRAIMTCGKKTSAEPHSSDLGICLQWTCAHCVSVIYPCFWTVNTVAWITVRACFFLNVCFALNQSADVRMHGLQIYAHCRTYTASFWDVRVLDIPVYIIIYMYPSQWNVLLHSSIHFQSKLQRSAALAANWNTGPICCQCTCLCGQSPLRRRLCQRTRRCACQTDDFIVQFACSTQVQQQFLQQSVTI